MNSSDPLPWWVVGLVIAGLVSYFLFRQLSPEVRERRKRRRNYGKVTNRVGRLGFTLKARTPKR